MKKKSAFNDVCVFIPSKGRAETCSKSISMFSDNVYLYVHESEVDDYSGLHKDVNIIKHEKTKGYGSVINGIIEKSKMLGFKYVVVIDDDIESLMCHVGNRSRVLCLDRRNAAIYNAAQVMSDIDCSVYLFGSSSSVVKYSQANPFGVSLSMPRGLYLLRTDVDIRFNESLQYFEDFDFFMEYIVKRKFIISEQRIAAITHPKSDGYSGGANDFRGSKQLDFEVNYLTRKWGSSISFTTNKSGNVRPVCNLKFRRG